MSKRIEVVIKISGDARICVYANKKETKELTSLVIYPSFSRFLLDEYKDKFVVISNLKPTNNRRKKKLVNINADDIIEGYFENDKHDVSICISALKAYFKYIPRNLYFQVHSKLNTKSNLKKYENNYQESQGNCCHGRAYVSDFPCCGRM